MSLLDKEERGEVEKQEQQEIKEKKNKELKKESKNIDKKPSVRPHDDQQKVQTSAAEGSELSMQLSQKQSRAKLMGKSIKKVQTLIDK